ncbi:MAG: nucleotidyl transferase AbiEii/AbiGii toxin family protein [Chloroflexota bacterium]
MDQNFYLSQLYPFQDQVLRQLSSVDTGFYLTGGTALSRGYLDHRFSDDLDFFVDDDPRFGLWAERFIRAISQPGKWECQMLLREERFVRLNVVGQTISLKIEMINDVPSRIGEPWIHPLLGRIDTAENILANKVTAALDRAEPKDLADIWGLCHLKSLSLNEAITGAQGKAAGIFPADLARVLCSVTHADWEMVRWIHPPDPQAFIAQLNTLGKNLIITS